MTTKKTLCAAVAVIAVAVCVASWRPAVSAQGGGGAVRIDGDDIGGVVTSAKGPEAGVWVIAETKSLPTGFRKMVATDDQGRYVVPDLPKGTYDVWVRGYGLVDSAKTQTVPGKLLNLTATVAPNARAAAEYYPANYWYSLLQPPAKSEFPGTGPSGNGIATTMKTQEQFLSIAGQDGCITCHQLGTKGTREIPKSLGTFASSVDAWERRLQSSQSGQFMDARFTTFGRKRGLAMYADWTDRVAKGELPPVPPRPTGAERNIVVTSWDWGDAKLFIHDAVSTDKRTPTVNGYGLVYGMTELSGDFMVTIDPVKNVAEKIPVPQRQTGELPWAWPVEAMQPSPYWGEEIPWHSKIAPHSNQMDRQGRMWITTREGCTWYDAKTRQFSKIPANVRSQDGQPTGCVGGHHIKFDEKDRLYFDSGGLGWFDTRMWEKTRDAAKSGGIIPFILDTNGNGKQDAYVGPNDPVDPTKDKQIPNGGYDVAVSPVDGSAWIVPSTYPGTLIRVSVGETPPKSSLAEMYEPPLANMVGHSTRGVDIDSKGIVWMAMASGHLASFDRAKCKVLNGPSSATGQHCPEGWKFYEVPGPKLKGTNNTADASYLTFVDVHNTSGMGNDTVFWLGSNSDSLQGRKTDGTWVVWRVPYPLSFFPKYMDGRIDDPKAGWKGRGLWSSYAGTTMWHQETGMGSTSKAVHFQMRPDPLAK